jgi:hypothetical protein
MLPEPALEPRDQPVGEVDHTSALLVDERVLLFVRHVQGVDPSADRSVEELKRGPD